MNFDLSICLANSSGEKKNSKTDDRGGQDEATANAEVAKHNEN